ncbi:MAG: AAA-like domain-containing protein, partial [Candidatus Thiosymbion ectosymbiont of Robbea hypermnestra]|nr:AAA-like domain-containing protein [Candidatus Thiosymbion ectosymbiont of Robbea hypermnestra]
MSSSIYTVGGSVDSETRAYVERTADQELLELCLDGELGYLLTSRQMGKSSMMVHTVRRLNQQSVRTVSITLEQIGTSDVTPEQWYLALLMEIEEQLGLDTAALAFWEEHAHLSHIQRFSNYLERVVLTETRELVVVFIDEIDTTLSLGFSSDDFFAAIRRLYNRRAERPELKRLGFVLIGVATPDDLIADPNRTPFNVGTRVELADFGLEEAHPLAAGLPVPDQDRDAAMARVLHWTDGHPFLTQCLCAALASNHAADYPGEGLKPWIDRTTHALFFDQQAAQDSNLDFVRNMLTQRIPRGTRPQEIPLTYQRILAERPPEPDEERSAVKNHLKLSGVVKRRGPNLVVRNRIYRDTFDKDWVKQQLPTEELARQLWRKLTTTLAPVSILISLLLALLAGFAFYQANQAEKARRTAEEARQIAEDQHARAEHAGRNAQAAQTAVRIGHLSASGLLAAYSPIPYAEDQRRATLLVRQAWNLTRTQPLPKDRLKSLPRQALSNLLRANQVIGHLGATWQGHSGPVESVAFSPDGTRVVSGSQDKSLRLWDTATGQPIGEPWQGHSGPVESVAFSPDGTRVVSGSEDNTLRLWDAATGQPIGEPLGENGPGHSGPVYSVAFSPDGTRVVSGSQDKSLRLWNAATGKPLGTPWRGHGDWVLSVAFSPDGGRVVSGSGDKSLRLWDVATGQTIGGPFGENGPGHSGPVESVAFSPDGRRVVSGSGDKSLRLWDVATGRQSARPKSGHSCRASG